MSSGTIYMNDEDKANLIKLQQLMGEQLRKAGLRMQPPSQSAVVRELVLQKLAELQPKSESS
jgi:hypothetical protein